MLCAGADSSVGVRFLREFGGSGTVGVGSHLFEVFLGQVHKASMEGHSVEVTQLGRFLRAQGQVSQSRSSLGPVVCLDLG